MIPKITRGARMAGLLVYLVGPGKANEHCDQHMVAGDDATWLEHGGHHLTELEARRIAWQLDAAHRNLGVEVNGGHVWHCSLSLPPDEPALSDEKWGRIARDFIHEMGFDDQDGSRSPCAWAAIRHGLNKGGGDHIHIALSLVRDDGTKANTWHDFRRAQQACRVMETRYGLTELESVKMGRSTIGFEKVEAARVKRTTGQTNPVKIEQTERGRLALLVRAAAVASSDEGEFVRRLRDDGVLVRARFDEGGTDVVTGFSVALRPVKGERPIWFGAGRLAHDLALPRLRENWANDPASRVKGLAEWTAARQHRPPTKPGPIAARRATIRYARWANQQLGGLVEELHHIPFDNTTVWVPVCRQMAGVLAGLSKRLEPDEPGPLATAATQLGAVSSTWVPVSVTPDLNIYALTNIAAMGHLARHSDDPSYQALITARNLAHLVVACRAFMIAQKQLRLATQAFDVATTQLALLHEVWEQRTAAEMGVEAVPERPIDKDISWDKAATPPGRQATRRARHTQQPSPAPGEFVAQYIATPDAEQAMATKPTLVTQRPLTPEEQARARLAAMDAPRRQKIMDEARNLVIYNTKLEDVQDPLMREAYKLAWAELDEQTQMQARYEQRRAAAQAAGVTMPVPRYDLAPPPARQTPNPGLGL